MTDTRALGTQTIHGTEAWDRSPFVQGLLTGAKGALVGGPMAGFVQAMRGKSPGLGALAGALGVGLIAGLSKYIAQDVANKTQEGAIRYYAEDIKEQEPLFFMPPPSTFGSLFSRLHAREHVRPVNPMLRENT